MNTFYTVILTLIIYSIISTIIIGLSNENEDIITAFGFGIFGCFLTLVSKIIEKIQRLFKYHIGKRSIFEEKTTGKKYKCKTKYTNNIIHWTSGYKLITRCATKSEWVNIPDFSNEFIENSKRNCDNCKYDKECVCNYPYENIKCKHDEFGKVIAFNRFEQK